MRALPRADSIITILVVVLLATSMVAPLASATSTTASTSTSAAPSGMVGVPVGQVGPPDHAGESGPPDHADEPGPPLFVSDRIPSDAGVWNAMATDHAGNLEIEIGETDDGELGMRLTDDVTHDGRSVAVSRSALADAVGHRPTAAHGVHESGERWTSPVRYQGEYAIFDVPKFSTNTVTFDGEVVINGSSVSNGTSFTYDVDSADGVDELNVSLTGDIATNDASKTGTAADGDSLAIDASGNLAPENGSISFTNPTPATQEDTASGVGDGPIDTAGETQSWTADVSNLDQIDSLETVFDLNTNNAGSVAVKVTVGGVDMGTRDLYFSETETVGSDELFYATYNDSQIDVSGTSSVTLQLELMESMEYASDMWYDYGGDNDNVPWAEFRDETTAIDVTHGGTTQTVSATGSTSLDISLGSQAIDLAFVDGGGQVDYAVDWTEHAETESPAVKINGEQVSHTGTLADGETAVLDPDPAWIREGTNDVTVETAEASGLGTVVGLDYSHPAAVDQTVSYESEAWSERYNVSRTWDSATTDASVTIPFKSSRVVAIRDVETRTNGGEWASLPSGDIALEGTTLEAQLGEVSEGDEIDVRATGSKVGVSGGSIDVIEPTVEGDTLDTSVEIVEHSDSFTIDVGGTSEGDWVHYTESESWTAPETFVVIDSSGSQKLHAPGASAGSTTRVKTAPLEVMPSSGSVEFELRDSSEEMTFHVNPSSSVSEVEYRYYDTISGEKYVLYSDTHGIARDSATASSPVSLFAGAYEETLTIILDSDDGNETTSSGSGGGPISTAASEIGPLLTLLVAVGAIVGTGLVATRTDVSNWLVGVIGVVVLVLSLEMISPESPISDGFRSAIVMMGSGAGPMMPLVILITVSSTAYALIRWVQGRTGPDTEVTFDLGGSRK